MDRLDRYREIIRQTLQSYAKPPSYGSVESVVVTDSERDEYLLLGVGC